MATRRPFDRSLSLMRWGYALGGVPPAAPSPPRRLGRHTDPPRLTIVRAGVTIDLFEQDPKKPK